MRLSRFERHQAAVIGRAIIPAGALGGFTDQSDPGGDIARQFALTPWWSAMLVRLALWAIWFAPVWRLGRLRTFAGLSAAEQADCLDRLARSDIYWLRELMLLFKMTVCLAVIGRRDVLTYLGAYDLAGGPVAVDRSGT